MSLVITQSLILASPETTDGTSPNAPAIGWQNFVTPSRVVADFEDDDYPATNVANPSTAEFWRSTSDELQYISVAIGEIREIDYIAVARHNLGSSGTPIRVEYRVGQSDEWIPVSDEVILPDDEPFIFRFAAVDANEVRVRFGGGTEPPEMAVLYVGALLLLQRNIYVGHVPINYGRSVRVTNGRSESGNFLGRIVTSEEKRSAVSLQNITPDWMRQRMMPFTFSAITRPFFFSWRPIDYPREVGYCWLRNDPQPRNQRPNGMMEITLEYGGIAGEAGAPIIAPPVVPDEPIT